MRVSVLRLTLCAFLTSTVWCGEAITLTKIADPTTIGPSGTTAFSTLERIAIRGSDVRFFATDESEGIFSGSSGAFTRLTTPSMSVEGTTGTLSSLYVNAPTYRPTYLALDPPRTAFLAYLTSGYTILVHDGVSLRSALGSGQSVNISGVSERLTGLGHPSIDQNVFAFTATAPSGKGVYTSSTTSMVRIVDTSTTIPGTSNLFITFSQVHIKNGRVVFAGDWNYASPGGVYTAPAYGGTLAVVADQSTIAPGSEFHFRPPFGDTAINQAGQVAFYGTSDVTGLYTNVGGSLTRVADSTTDRPEGGKFHFSSTRYAVMAAGPLAIENGRIVFTDMDTAGPGGDAVGVGVYMWEQGSITKIVAVGDTVDGRTVTSASSSAEGLSGNRVALILGLSDLSGQSLYIADLPGQSAAGEWCRYY